LRISDSIPKGDTHRDQIKAGRQMTSFEAGKPYIPLAIYYSRLISWSWYKSTEISTRETLLEAWAVWG